jgi:uncharacterized protein YcaQ
MTLSKAHARRFLLAHQRLRPARQLSGKTGIMEFVAHVGCIQFDPINVVGCNPDLVLQSRIVDYAPSLLEELLYTDHQLIDGFDKVASIYQASDWPYFTRRRNYTRDRHGAPSNPPMRIAPDVLEAIREQGPLSSIDLKHSETIDWRWGNKTRISRACLELLYEMGDLVVDHRIGTRRVFNLAERALPAQLLSARDPNSMEKEYQDWHVLRRVGGLGLANPSAAQYWQGILGVNGKIRRQVLSRLVQQGDLTAVAIEGVESRTLFIRTADLTTLEATRDEIPVEPIAAIVGPLDNLMWDRDLLRWAFEFDYVWEVYKPAAQRKYGYYVLPVLYGDRFVARFDPAFDRETHQLSIRNWWWEDGIEPDEEMMAAVRSCLNQFARYLGAEWEENGGWRSEV